MKVCNVFIIIAVIALFSCDVHHESTWVIQRSPDGSSRAAKARKIVKDEAQRVGLSENGDAKEEAEIVFGFQLEDDPRSWVDVLSVRGANDTTLINLNTGFGSRASPIMGFDGFRDHLDSVLNMQIGRQHISSNPIIRN